MCRSGVRAGRRSGLCLILRMLRVSRWPPAGWHDRPRQAQDRRKQRAHGRRCSVRRPCASEQFDAVTCEIERRAQQLSLKRSTDGAQEIDCVSGIMERCCEPDRAKPPARSTEHKPGRDERGDRPPLWKVVHGEKQCAPGRTEPPQSRLQEAAEEGLFHKDGERDAQEELEKNQLHCQGDWKFATIGGGLAQRPVRSGRRAPKRVDRKHSERAERERSGRDHDGSADDGALHPAWRGERKGSERGNRLGPWRGCVQEGRAAAAVMRSRTSARMRARSC